MITLRVQDVMTRETITVGPDTPLKEVARIMVDHGISGIPVVESGLVIGVVSEADLLVKERGAEAIQGRRFARIFGESRATQLVREKVEATIAREAMSQPPITISEDRPAREAADIMVERQVNRLPVVDDQGLLRGIVTRADVIRSFVRPGADLLRIVREDVLRRALWVDPETLQVTVQRGNVIVRGTVDRRSTAETLAVLVGQIDGVVSVDSDVSWMLDDSKPEPEPQQPLFPYS